MSLFAQCSGVESQSPVSAARAALRCLARQMEAGGSECCLECDRLLDSLPIGQAIFARGDDNSRREALAARGPDSATGALPIQPPALQLTLHLHIPALLLAVRAGIPQLRIFIRPLDGELSFAMECAQCFRRDQSLVCRLR